MNLESSQRNELLYVGFNQDQSCFACGTESGFRVYSCDPFAEKFRRDFSKGGIGLVEMLFQCSLVALVGGGKNPQFPPNRVILWDDVQKKDIGNLSYKSPVLSVRLRRDQVVVVLRERLYVYNFADLRLVNHCETYDNPKGLCCLSADSENNVLAFPAIQKGYIRVESSKSSDPVLIQAHNGPIAAMALSQDGSLVATCSDKGTMVRIFDTVTGDPVQQFKRGISEAEIFSVAFSKNSEMLAVSSSRSTIHIFKISPGSSSVENWLSSGNEGFLSGFSSSAFNFERSFAQFKVPNDIQTIVSFGSEPNSLVIIGSDGSVYNASFDLATGGACKQLSYHQVIPISQ